MTRLRQYGSDVGLEIKNFPDCVDPEYLEAWGAYITTQTAVDLFHSLPQPMGMQRVVEGFLSSLSKTSTKFLIRAVPGPSSVSIKEARALLTLQYQALKKWQQRIQFSKQLRLAEVLSRTSSEYNRVANSINTTIDIYLVYVPQTTTKGIPKVGEMLNKQVPYWFSNKRPKALFKTDNLTMKLAKSPTPVVTDTYPSIHQAMLDSRLWHLWNLDIGVECMRVKGNAFAIHIQSRRLCCFLGSNRRHMIEKKLNSLVRSIFI
ncbi:hypothetical protein HOS33_gp178 [Erwinia phage vB_EamM_Y3]|uniref:Uncharacterized protein n=1 Tax=Erwinia phage vB_EamM_Y3 TaxID=1983553 RepID=A0A2H4IB95_9CAUD|nr:hypothetical protein HOS33_gp178 [Erwinia phage vB_EamM_Y3]ARW58818.1 hypothetical protein Y3_178 [Erwinia phage vB_EamM_Y3]QZE56041.1 hypothetical protein pEaSNUABM52_00183 [Erwinia phage pEp_SNUABM_52]